MHVVVAPLFASMLVVSISEASHESDKARAAFMGGHPAVRLYETDSRITRVYGPSFGFGMTPRETRP